MNEITAFIVRELLSSAVHKGISVAYTTKDSKMRGGKKIIFGDRLEVESSKMLDSAGMPAVMRSTLS